jgi:ubiquitin carboxyl-terminal hydrolase 7
MTDRIDDVMEFGDRLQSSDYNPLQPSQESYWTEWFRKAQLYIEVHVATDKSFKGFSGLDVMPEPEPNLNSQTLLYSFGVLKSMHVQEFVRNVAQELGEDPKACMPWSVVRRQNGTRRPSAPIKDQERTIGATAMVSKLRIDTYIWMEVAGPMDKNHKSIFSSSHRFRVDILLFLKVFDVEAQSLSGIGHFYAPQLIKVAEITPRILKLTGWPEFTPIRMFEVSFQTLVD